jgi:hypothetical protein
MKEFDDISLDIGLKNIDNRCDRFKDIDAKAEII